MSREYFLLLGRVVGNSFQDPIIINQTKIWDYLNVLHSHRNLEYLSRIVLTSLAFSDGGYNSESMFLAWAQSSSTSRSLKEYCFVILYTLLRSRPYEFLKWGLGALKSLISPDKPPDMFLLRTLQEAIMNKLLLKTFIAMKPTSLLSFSSYAPAMSPAFMGVHPEKVREVQETIDSILCRFASVDEGVAFLEASQSGQFSWINQAISRWESVECIQYTKKCERELASVFCTYTSPRSSSAVQPISFDASDIPYAPHKDVVRSLVIIHHMLDIYINIFNIITGYGRFVALTVEY